MGRKNRAYYARLQNISTARLKRAQNREETRPDTTTHLTISSSEDHPRAGLDGGGGGDEEASGASPDITELTALEHFSSILQSAQRRAAEAEGSRRKRTHYTGQSERTIGRRKKALRDLQAQGFHTLPDFFRQKAEKAMQKAKIEAMEEEESSGTETAADECSFKIVSEPGTTEGTLEASNEKALGDSDRTGDNSNPTKLDCTELGRSK